MLKSLLAHIALFMANAIYAINYILAKDVMPDYLGPKAFILVRVLGASIVFFIMHYFFIKEKVSLRDYSYLFICSLFGVVINMLCFFEGLSITSPINASLIMITTPIIVYILSYFFLKEEGQYKIAMGVVLGFIGATLLITDGKLHTLSDYNIGDMLIFINAASYAAYLILIKPMMQKYHPFTVLKTIFIMGSVIILPISWNEISAVDWYSIPLNISLSIGYVVFFTTCGAYFLNIYAISKVKASTVSFYIYLQPLLASFLAIYLGRDHLTSTQCGSAFLIIIGVYFVITRK
jgi:drug/metabolite transporter (DMT)-like permease